LLTGRDRSGLFKTQLLSSREQSGAGAFSPHYLLLGGHVGSSVLVPLMGKGDGAFTAIDLLFCLLNPFSSGLRSVSRAFLGGTARSGRKMTVRAASAVGLI